MRSKIKTGMGAWRQARLLWASQGRAERGLEAQWAKEREWARLGEGRGEGDWAGQLEAETGPSRGRAWLERTRASREEKLADLVGRRQWAG